MDFDVIIIGAGPSGLTAGIYAVRSGLNVAVIEKQFAGGQIANTDNKAPVRRLLAAHLNQPKGFPVKCDGFLQILYVVVFMYHFKRHYVTS